MYKILPSITNLENTLKYLSYSASGQNISNEDFNDSGIENVAESSTSDKSSTSTSDKSSITVSKSPLSQYGTNILFDKIHEAACQTPRLGILVPLLNKATSTRAVYEKEKAVQTFKKYYKKSIGIQTGKIRKPKKYSRKAQTNKLSVQQIKEIIKSSYPKSAFLNLNEDQFTRMMTGKKQLPFSSQSVLQGAKIRFTGGSSAYEILRDQVPQLFPSSRKIRETLSSFHISPGPIFPIIDLLSKKLRESNACDQKIVLVFDEISISKRVEYAPEINSYCGFPTLEPKVPNSEVQHCLIVMVNVLTLPIHVPVCVDFTTASTKPEALRDRLMQLICLFQSNQIEVVALCSDAGPLNSAVLKLLGVTADYLFERKSL